jgi:hypothetical protein
MLDSGDPPAQLFASSKSSLPDAASSNLVLRAARLRCGCIMGGVRGAALFAVPSAASAAAGPSGLPSPLPLGPAGIV